LRIGDGGNGVRVEEQGDVEWLDWNGFGGDDKDGDRDRDEGEVDKDLIPFSKLLISIE
jgi:hypothetical protein